MYNITGEVKAYPDLSDKVSNLPDPAQNGTLKRTLELGEVDWELGGWQNQDSIVASIISGRTTEGCSFTYEFPKQSVTIFRIK